MGIKSRLLTKNRVGASNFEILPFRRQTRVSALVISRLD